MANIDLVTSHQGQAHITTQNVIDLIGGLSGDITGIKKFPQLYNGLSHEITDTLTITISTGAALAGGSFFILENAYSWILDPGAVGYSRIDILYLVMYEDPETNVQSCDLVYEVGDLYPNGTTGTAPSAPTGTDITTTFPFLRCDLTDGSIVSVTDYKTSYLSNSNLETSVSSLVEELEESIGGTVEQVATNTNALNGLRFGQDTSGNYGYYKAGADTVTPFRNPTGNATQGQVLSGKIFSNATQENVAGTMNNYGGSNRRTVTPSGGTGNQQLSLSPGYHDSVIVDRTAPYNTGYNTGYSNGYSAGRTQGHADYTTHTLTITFSGSGNEAYARLLYDGTYITGTTVDIDSRTATKTIYTKYSGITY